MVIFSSDNDLSPIYDFSLCVNWLRDTFHLWFLFLLLVTYLHLLIVPIRLLSFLSIPAMPIVVLKVSNLDQVQVSQQRSNSCVFNNVLFCTCRSWFLIKIFSKCFHVLFTHLSSESAFSYKLLQHCSYSPNTFSLNPSKLPIYSFRQTSFRSIKQEKLMSPSRNLFMLSDLLAKSISIFL